MDGSLGLPLEDQALEGQALEDNPLEGHPLEAPLEGLALVDACEVALVASWASLVPCLEVG